jgi:hypothetical protein
MRSDLNKKGVRTNRLAALAVAMLLAFLAAYLAPGWYVHNLTARYENANGPLWTAEVQRAWGNVLDPLWEANHGAIQHLGEALGMDSVGALALPMRIRRFSAFLTGETVDTSDAVTSDADVIPLVFGAPQSLLDQMRDKDPLLNSDAGKRLLAAMAGFGDRKTLDDTYYDTAPRTEQAQLNNNPYARDGFRTYSFFNLARYAITRFEDGDAAARRWYMHRLCAGDWDYDVKLARAALAAAGHKPAPCTGDRPLPTFSQRVAADLQLPTRLWASASKRFGAYVFVLVLVLTYGITYPLLRIARSGRRP